MKRDKTKVVPAPAPRREAIEVKCASCGQLLYRDRSKTTERILEEIEAGKLYTCVLCTRILSQ